VEEETTKKPLKNIDHLDLALPKVPTKVLYKLQISVAQEIHSRASTDETSLQLANEVKRTLELTIDKVQFERDTVKQNIARIEHKVEEVFKTIPDSTQEGEILPT
jgi:hypothetical protein